MLGRLATRVVHGRLIDFSPGIIRLAGIAPAVGVPLEPPDRMDNVCHVPAVLLKIVWHCRDERGNGPVRLRPGWTGAVEGVIVGEGDGSHVGASGTGGGEVAFRAGRRWG